MLAVSRPVTSPLHRHTRGGRCRSERAGVQGSEAAAECESLLGTPTVRPQEHLGGNAGSLRRTGLLQRLNNTSDAFLSLDR